MTAIERLQKYYDGARAKGLKDIKFFFWPQSDKPLPTIEGAAEEILRCLEAFDKEDKEVLGKYSPVEL